VIPAIQCAPDELLVDPVFPRLKEYLIESTGLDYYADKDADLARRIRRRLVGLGFEDCASYFDLLRDPARGASEMGALIEEVTIGETYFFRHREHFDALRDLVLPGLVARNAGQRRLRIWCAGCADGAEPYSLSILLRRELAHLLGGWDVSILATDINRQCLATAREGRYQQWSLRSTPEEVKQACFEELGKAWTIAPQYKAGVSFQFHNLVEEAFPPRAFDLIICRNVMIYFGPKLMRRIVRQFHGSLAPGGWLLVGPSEPNMTHFTSFEAVNAPGVTLYRRPDTLVRDFLVDVPFPTMPPPAVAVSPEAPTLARLRRRADQGDWKSAAESGRELIEADNLNALAHFHYALVLEQLGNYAESEKSLRRAIYLDRQAVPAHYHLGLLLRSHGDPRQAERCFHNALDLLAPLAAGEILADADGITVAELRKLTLTQMESLKVRA
jgi:chemotaxis protein methyltransferase CheR